MFWRERDITPNTEQLARLVVQMYLLQLILLSNGMDGFIIIAEMYIHTL